MPEQQTCEFFLLRYVPDKVKNEYVNLGVVLLEDSREPLGFAEVRFARDLRRVKCLDVNTDMELLNELEADLRRRLRGATSRAEILRIIASGFSNNIQASAPETVITDSPAREVERIAQEYLEPTRREPELGGTHRGRMAIYGVMRSEFESAGVWRLMDKRIPMAAYTYDGDPLKMDCGYRLDQQMKMFHAVSLKSGIESAELLASRFAGIAAGMHRQDRVNAHLTAVIEDDLDRGLGPITFALRAFENSNIKTATVSEMPRVAEVARQELRV